MGYTVLKFTANWCMPCKMLSKEIEPLLDKYDFELVEIDVEKDVDTATQYMVTTVPTVIILKDGIPVDRVNGYTRLSDFKRWLTKYVPRKTGRPRKKN